VPFEFATAQRIVFGRGAAAGAADAVAALGIRPAVVTGADPSRAAWLADALRARGMEPLILAVTGEPTVALAADFSARARGAACDVVIGIGGGSALDAAKATAALVPNAGDILVYLEVVGQGQPIERPPLPCIAIPTTAGTGSEATRNAVLDSPEHSVKASMRSPLMLPRIAIVDPELGAGMPPDVTASTGLDALTQLLEAFVSVKANPITDPLCRDGMARAARSLRRAFADGADMDAREDMAMAALFGGIALANAGLGAVHGFAGPLGGMLHAPHGALCACLLPHVLEANARVLMERAPRSGALARLAEAARILTGNPAATAQDAGVWARALCRDLGVKPLGAFGLTAAMIPDAAAKARGASSMKGNPVALADAELEAILLAALA
jgi:alcohol dehydrogenase class IV